MQFVSQRRGAPRIKTTVVHWSRLLTISLSSGPVICMPVGSAFLKHRWNTHGGQGTRSRPGFNLLPSSSAQVLICVRWRGKLLGALE